PSERRNALRQAMRERLRARIGIHPVIDLVPQGSLPRTEFKARRVVDDRDLYRQALAERDTPAPGGTARDGPRPWGASVGAFHAALPAVSWRTSPRTVRRTGSG